jgi:hypothetical protein
MMTQPPNTRLTPDIARELCQRANSKAYIGGSIANIGSKYIIGLKAVNCLSEMDWLRSRPRLRARRKCWMPWAKLPPNFARNLANH